MCGIGAFFHTQLDSLEETAARLGSRLAHRGPDGSGVKCISTKTGVGLALVHRRLAIIDLSHAADQPMADEAGNVLVFNGEIYNYLELRTELERLGERFHTRSDTEVLLRAYRHFDLKTLLCRLRGMFAFSLWDNKKQCLVVARDPLGIKPLYFKNRGHFACASEASALVATGLVDDALSNEGLDSFLTYGSVVAPASIWRGVEALLPGHYLMVDAQGKVNENNYYWQWGRSGHMNMGDALSQGIDRHLVADVPVALFLSGGYDSTAIGSLAAAHNQSTLNSFTVSFVDNPDWSEGKAARMIAKNINTSHHDVQIDAKKVREHLPGFFAAMDQPSDDGLNVNIISAAVADAGFKVALHGVGGDELFGGYPSFRDLPKIRWVARLPKWLRQLVAGVVDGRSIARSKLAELLHSDGTLLSSFLIRRRLFSYEQRKMLFNGAPPLGRSGVPAAWAGFIQHEMQEAENIFSIISLLELRLYAANKLLMDGDVMSMSHGLEVRFPLLDVDIVNAALRLPVNSKRARKNIAKPALVNAIPNFPFGLMSKNKRGFTLPLEQWMRNEFKDECKSTLDSLPRYFGFDKSFIDSVWGQFEKSTGGQQWLRVWQLYALGKWKEKHNYCN